MTKNWRLKWEEYSKKSALFIRLVDEPLCKENNQLQGGRSDCASCQITARHSVVDYFPMR